MVLEESWALKQMFWAFEKSIFSVFCEFSSDEDGTVFWESEAMQQKPFR